MSTNTKLTTEDFAITTGEEPADWPERFEPGTMAKVISHGEGIWAKISEDDGATIHATLANNPFGDFAVFGDPVIFTRENVRNILPPTYG